MNIIDCGFKFKTPHMQLQNVSSNIRYDQIIYSSAIGIGRFCYRKTKENSKMIA